MSFNVSTSGGCEHLPGSPRRPEVVVVLRTGLPASSQGDSVRLGLASASFFFRRIIAEEEYISIY